VEAVSDDTHAAPLEDGQPALSVIAARFFFGFSSIALLLLSWAWPENGLWSPLVSTVLALFLVIVHILLSRRALASFDPLLWLPVLIVLFYFGMPVAIELIRAPGFQSYDALGVGPPPSLSRAFAVALFSLSAFIWGAHFTRLHNAQRVATPHGGRRSSLTAPGLCLIAGGLLMMAAGAIVVGPDLLVGRYGEMKEAATFGERDFRLLNSGVIFLSGGIFAVLAGHRSRTFLATGGALAAGAFLAAFLLFTGDRGGLAAFGLAAGWVFSRRVRRVGFIPVVAAFVAGFLIMPMIKEYRSYQSLEETRELDARDLAAISFYEMGHSVLAFAYTVEFIPETKPYDWGGSLLQATLNAIPNPGPSLGKGFMLDPLKHSPSKWYTATANPVKYYHHGAGYAYALGAVWYFNFGMPGILVGMAFMGYLTARLRNRASFGDWALVGSALFFQMTNLLIRNHFGFPLKTMLWPLIGLAIISLLWPRRSFPATSPSRTTTTLVDTP